MHSQVAELAGALTSFARTREVVGLAVGGILLGALLTLWQAVLAAGIAWMGWRLRRVPRTVPASAAGAAADPGSGSGPKSPTRASRTCRSTKSDFQRTSIR